MAWTPANAEEAVQALYIGYFGRAGEPGGVQYWINQINAAPNIQTGFALAAAAFSVQQEAKNEYAFLAAPDLASPVDFITSLYNNLLERAPDAAGLAYWTGQAQAAAGNPFAIGLLVAQFISGATNSAEGNDIDTLNNKVDAAEFFTQALADANITGTDNNGQVLPTVQEAGKNIIGAVTEDDATVTAANEASTAFAAGGATGEGVSITIGAGQSVSLNSANPALKSTESADSITGTLDEGQSIAAGGGNDNVNVTIGAIGGGLRATILGGSGNDLFTVVAPNATLFNLDGGANTDTLNLTIGASGVGGTSAIQNIENIKINSTANATVDGTKISGAETLVLTGAFDVNVSDLAANVAVTIKDSTTNGDFDVDFAGATPIDAATITIDNMKGGLDVTNVKSLTLNVVSNSVAEIIEADAQAVTITGSGELSSTQVDLTFASATGTVTFDASGLTAQTALVFDEFLAAADIKLTDQNDFTTFDLQSNFNAAINTGAGNDTTTITDLSNLSFDGTDVDSFATMTGFNAGDTLIINEGVALTLAVTNQAAFVGAADLEAALTIASTQAGAVANSALVFEFQGSTYVYIEEGTAGAGADDGLLQLVGVTGVTTSLSVGGDLTITV